MSGAPTARVRAAALTAVAMMLGAMVCAPQASAISPPSIDGVAPPPGSVGPEAPMRASYSCRTPGQLEGSNFTDPTPAARLLNLEAVRPLADGAGVKIALLDTGVTPNFRLPNVQAGGDYITEGDDGLVDCDGHGTLVAGIINAAPNPNDSLVGVAPAATVFSIRQSSGLYALQDPPQDRDAQSARTAVDVRAMARAVVHAVDLGAQVINISMTACMPALRPVDDAMLGAAVHWAVAERNVVVVAAAGNTGSENRCVQNPPTRQDDPAAWNGVVTVATPAWWSADVLTVGSVNEVGAPSSFTLWGPWVGVAAPGERITSLGNYPDGRLVNGELGQQGQLVPVYGSSYSTAYVSGLVALVRQRFPQLNAYEVMHRIKATAHAGPGDPDQAVGAGVIDPVAALTWNVPERTAPPPPAAEPIIPAAPPPAPDRRPDRVAAWMLGGFTLAAATVVAVAAALRGKPQR
jgi:membrane-anchored mycosin MYCP